MRCQLCHKNKKRLVGHHLSYRPEKIIFICQLCHHAIHNFNLIPPKYQEIAWNMIKTYGRFWQNGCKKYFKSNYSKTYRKDYYAKNIDKKKTYALKWNKEHKPERAKIVHEYYITHKNSISEYQKKWWKNHPEKNKEYKKVAKLKIK